MQLVGLFQVDRNEDGSVKIAQPESPGVSPERAFRNMLFLCGVTEPETVAAMWAAEKAKREAAATAAKAVATATRQRRRK